VPTRRVAVPKAVESELALFVDPPSHHFLEDRLFDSRTVRLAGDDLHAPYVHLKKTLEAAGIRVHTADRLFAGAATAKCNVYMSFGIRRRAAQLAQLRQVVPSAFFAFESPIVEPGLYRDLPRLARSLRRVFSFSDVQSLRPFIGSEVMLHPFRIPQQRATVHQGLWERRDRGFLVMINANKLPRLSVNELYTERLRAVAHFEERSEIDLYGVGWDVPPFRMGQTRTPVVARRAIRWVQSRWERVRRDPLLGAARRAWRGVAESKAHVLSRYRFAVCFENMILPGYITEKIFDCFGAGTVPVYWGAPDITDAVPPECFIDMRRFSDYEELRGHLRSLSDAEVDGHRQAAREFLSSSAFHPFRKEEFTRLIAGIVAEDTGIDVNLTWS
jgi:hypothetical protein